MARVVKDYDERHSEFLDAAQSLFFSKGYEQTSVQDIIKAVGVAKGTFYHYFESKLEILDAVVKRARKGVLAKVTPIVEDESLNAIDKFIVFFEAINNWKLDNHAIVLNMLRMLYQDENALLRLKMFEQTRQIIKQPLARIIEEGMASATFGVDYAYETAEVIVRMLEMPSHTLVSVLLSGAYDDESLPTMQREILVFNRSIERVLGVGEGTFDLIKAEDLSGWLALLDKISVEETV